MILASSIMAPGYERMSQDYFERYARSGATNASLFTRFLENRDKAVACREIIRVLEEILEDDEQERRQ